MATARTARKKFSYGVHPGVKMVQEWVAKLPEKTGRSLEEWIELVRKSGPADEKKRREWLKTKFNLGTNGAWWIAERAEGKGGEDSDPESYLKVAVQYVEEQYSGPKEKLRPIYDALLEMGTALGTDVKACPCKTIVPLYREHVFAQIKPTTNTRIDLGLALGNHKTPKRIINTGGFQKKDRITHRIPVSSLDEIDDELKRWLRTAYDLDA
ncbi:MAG: DUF5655 domain-containing protein [Candidatus Acidiferrales bacterium]